MSEKACRHNSACKPNRIQAPVTTVGVFTLALLSACTQNPLSITDPFIVDPFIKTKVKRSTFFGVSIKPVNLDDPIPWLHPELRRSCARKDDGAPTASLAERIRACPTMYGYAQSGAKSRNQVQSYLMRYSERICDKHLAAIIAYKAGLDLGASLLTAGITAAGALVTGGTAQILSGAASGVNASRAAITADIYQRFLSTAVVKEIKSIRVEYEAVIDNRRFKENGNGERRLTQIELYTADDAIRDVIIYHRKCSFYVGLTSLAHKAGRITDDNLNIAQKAVLESLIKSSKDRVVRLEAKLSENPPQPLRTQLETELKEEKAHLKALEARLKDVIGEASKSK